jgi:hypothetical protein
LFRISDKLGISSRVELVLHAIHPQRSRSLDHNLLAGGAASRGV